MYKHLMELGLWVSFTFHSFPILFIHIQTSALLGHTRVSKKYQGKKNRRQIKASDLVELRVSCGEIDKKSICAEAVAWWLLLMLVPGFNS